MDAEHFDAMLRSLAAASRRSIVVAVAATLGHTLGETAAEAGGAIRRPRRQPQNRSHRQQVDRERVGAERRKKRKKRGPAPTPPGGPCADVICVPVANGSASYQNGTCVITCDTGFTLCGSECVDAETDVTHCGACGTVCPFPPNGSAVCLNERCAINCESPLIQCGNECVDRRSDPNNCGVCGYRCPAGPCQTATCSAGMCGAVPNDLCQVFTGEGCYKLENSGCWVRVGVSPKATCEDLSASCGSSAGSCYKWATSSCE
jgi:hypothetical protein